MAWLALKCSCLRVQVDVEIMHATEAAPDRAHWQELLTPPGGQGTQQELRAKAQGEEAVAEAGLLCRSQEELVSHLQVPLLAEAVGSRDEGAQKSELREGSYGKGSLLLALLSSNGHDCASCARSALARALTSRCVPRSAR